MYDSYNCGRHAQAYTETIGIQSRLSAKPKIFFTILSPTIKISNRLDSGFSILIIAFPWTALSSKGSSIGYDESQDETLDVSHKQNESELSSKKASGMFLKRLPEAVEIGGARCQR